MNVPAPHGYVAADAAAKLLGLRTATISRLSRRERWRRIRHHRGWVYLLADVRATERNRRIP